jgi:hypothetical protein
MCYTTPERVVQTAVESRLSELAELVRAVLSGGCALDRALKKTAQEGASNPRG